MITGVRQGWARALANPAPEFALTPLEILTGSVPEGRRGSLYRNGPGRLERGGISVGHWFDGDGAVLAVHFREGGVTATYRYVQSQGYRLEEKAGRLLHAGYGMVPPGPWWEQWRYGLKNAANTSVLALPDKLLALWEGGHPHALDLETLATRRLDDLGGLAARTPYSAHPKRDPQTGDIYNFGVVPGPNAVVHVVRSDRTGKIKQQGQFSLSGFPLLHDFVLAGQYLIFCVSPARLNFLPVALYLKSFSEMFTWQPQLGTQIILLDRHTLQVIGRGETEPWFQWHFGNGYVDPNGQVRFTLVRYPDLSINQFLREVATGKTHTPAQGNLVEIKLDPQKCQVKEISLLTERQIDFPTVDPQCIGQVNPVTYLSILSKNMDASGELLDTFGYYDHRNYSLVEAELPVGFYAMEPLYCSDSLYPSRGWLLTVVYDSIRHRSEVWVYQADQLTDGPVTRLALPSVVPMGFHGTWRGAS